MRVQIRYVILEVALIIGILLLGISSVGVLKNFVKIQFYCTDISYTDEDFSQYFYITQGEVETEEKSIKMDCSKKNRITVSRYKNSYLDTCIRIDPYNKEEDFGIEKITYTVLGIPVGKLYPEEIEKFIFGDNVDEVQLKEGVLWFQAKDADPYVIFGKELTKHYDENIANMRVFLSGVFMLILYMLTFIVRQKIIWKERNVYFFKLRLFLGSVLLIMGILIFRGTEIALLMYGEIPISQLIFHIKVPLEGTNWSQFSEVFIQLGMQLGIVILVLALLGYIFFKKNKWNEIARIYVPVGIISICVGVINFSIKFDLMEYIQYTKEETSLYEDYYVDARDVDIIFPEKKRNLIYIYMESMETSYASVQEGGGKEINYIPELTKLVLENEQFSDANTLNGAYIVNGAGFTMGALAAQTT